MVGICQVRRKFAGKAQGRAPEWMSVLSVDGGRIKQEVGSIEAGLRPDIHVLKHHQKTAFRRSNLGVAPPTSKQKTIAHLNA